MPRERGRVGNRVGTNRDYPVITESDRLWERARGLIPAGTQTLAKGPGQFVRGGPPKRPAAKKPGHSRWKFLTATAIATVPAGLESKVEDVLLQMMSGAIEVLNDAGCALVGGETAELPGMYSGKDYDLAGFAVGVVEKGRIIDGSKVVEGDVLIGLASSGPHSNGYSLIRKVLSVSAASFKQHIGVRTLIDHLLEPTRIYVKSLLALITELPVSALAHITGGGIVENLPRVLPDTAKAIIRTGGWTRPPVFDWLQNGGAIADAEM